VNKLKLFRVVLEVSNLDQAAEFYSTLLGKKGRRIRGGRHYFDCGSVIVAILDVTMGERSPHPIPEYLYFAVNNLEEMHSRASQLKCLSKEKVHGESAAKILIRPWGEKSFYAEDPWGNGLCFVDEKTLFTGK
jgi:catechol-2,3-dioxygenase